MTRVMSHLFTKGQFNSIVRTNITAITSLVAILVLSADAASAQQQARTRNGLPPTSLDSFVNEAGQYKELIYGDESFHGPPPYAEFTRSHRINAGIFGTRDQGLTTGHGSWMPSAVGADEFVQPPGEWDRSGPQGVVMSDGMYAGGSYLTPGITLGADYASYQTPGPAQDYTVLPAADDATGLPEFWNQILKSEYSNQQWIQQSNGLWTNNVTGATVNSQGLPAAGQ